MDGIKAYQENAVTTQSQGRLVVMLYEGAVKFLAQALEALEAGDDTRKGACIVKALAIINELDACLDTEAGGEVAMNLRRLYDFMSRHLQQANTRRDSQAVRDVIGLLEDLNEGWKAIAT
ncbi:MAG: flagellar export chaperone FliS [Phycisphaerae bacterium]|nr:flagellar export chaperone FliS [Phycisphaerae bacterium]